MDIPSSWKSAPSAPFLRESFLQILRVKVAGRCRVAGGGRGDEELWEDVCALFEPQADHRTPVMSTSGDVRLSAGPCVLPISCRPWQLGNYSSGELRAPLVHMWLIGKLVAWADE